MKKGQVQLGELVIIVIIVMVLLIMGIVLYGSFKSRSLGNTVSESRSLDAVELAHDASSLPEIGCGFSQEETECIDLVRLAVFSEQYESAGPNSDFRNYYQYRFGSSNISVEKVYPMADGEESSTWTIYENVPSDFRSQTSIMLPVTLYNSVEKTNSFGVMTVVMYS